MRGSGKMELHRQLTLDTKGSSAEELTNASVYSQESRTVSGDALDGPFFFSKSRVVFCFSWLLMAHLKGRSLRFACGWIFAVTSGFALPYC